jgi:hypothetical protein
MSLLGFSLVFFLSKATLAAGTGSLMFMHSARRGDEIKACKPTNIP